MLGGSNKERLLQLVFTEKMPDELKGNFMKLQQVQQHYVPVNKNKHIKERVVAVHIKNKLVKILIQEA